MNMIKVCTPDTAVVERAVSRPAEEAREIGEYAERALLTELLLTPKPGLVDRRNSGAHRNMDFQTFLASTRAIGKWFPRFVQIGLASAEVPACDFLAMVRPAGVSCESDMFRATKGVNTHKGGIFSLALLCGATGRLLGLGLPLERESICTEVARICAGLVERELGHISTARTAGERIYLHHGLSGARGEAASGFATARTIALPVYERLRLHGVREETALLQVLLHLLATNGDTNVVSRGGLAGLEYVRNYAMDLLQDGGVLESDGVKKMEAFDDALIERNLSPGGSADLLAVAWFLAQFPASPAA